MRELIDFAHSKSVMSFVNSIIEYPIVHGVQVDIHPLWLYDWSIKMVYGLDPAAIRGFHIHFGCVPSMSPPAVSGYPDYNFGFSSQPWRDFCRSCGKNENPPFIVRVLLRPISPDQVLE